MKLAVACLALLACGGSSTGPDPDAMPDSPAATCEESCYEARWWINVGESNCTVLCMANPSAPECGHADCEQVSAQRYDGGGLRTLAPLLHSAENRSFDLLGGLMTDTYTVTAGCTMQVESRPEQSFSCDGDTLTFSVGMFTAASMGQQVALDSAATAGTPGEYPY